MNSINSSGIFYTVYQNSFGVIQNQPSEGFRPVQVPLAMDYKDPEGGGYLAIYTRDPEDGKYAVGNEGGSPIYVAGLIRVQGSYKGNIFIPTEGEKAYDLGDDITKDPLLLEICKKHFPNLKSPYWVGGDTGGFFALNEAKRIGASSTFTSQTPFKGSTHRRFMSTQAAEIRERRVALLKAEKEAVIKMGMQNMSSMLRKKGKHLFM